MAKYTQAELHSNGETINFSNATEANRLRGIFKGAAFIDEAAEKEYVISHNQCSFAVFTIDEPSALGEKPQCNNAFDCSPTDPEPGEE